MGWSCGTIRMLRTSNLMMLPNTYKKVWWHRNPHGDRLIFTVVSCPTHLLGKRGYLNNTGTARLWNRCQSVFCWKKCVSDKLDNTTDWATALSWFWKNTQLRWKDARSSRSSPYHLFPCRSSCRNNEEEEVKSKVSSIPCNKALAGQSSAQQLGTSNTSSAEPKLSPERNGGVELAQGTRPPCSRGPAGSTTAFHCSPTSWKAVSITKPLWEPQQGIGRQANPCYPSC